MVAHKQDYKSDGVWRSNTRDPRDLYFMTGLNIIWVVNSLQMVLTHMEWWTFVHYGNIRPENRDMVEK